MPETAPRLGLSSSSDSLRRNVVVQRVARDRVEQRRRAAALARHYRDQESLTIAEIARRLGRAEATVKAYLYDPTGAKAREVKARYRGACRGCGAPTSARNGKGDAHEYCKTLPSRRDRAGMDARTGARSDAGLAARYGSPPSSYDWSRSHASRRGPEALARLQDAEWPPASTVSEVYGSWAAARADAFPDA